MAHLHDLSLTGPTVAFAVVPPVPNVRGCPRPAGTAGNLTVLDWAGFAGAVSYSFDDGCSSQLEGYPRIKALGIRATFYLCSAWSSADNGIWADALQNGHELGNHTAHHPNADGNGGQYDIAADTDDCSAFLQSRYQVTPRTMAAPYGDPGYIEIARKRFLLHRGVQSGVVLPNSKDDPCALPSHTPAEGASAGALNELIDAACASGAWQILTLHGFSGGTDNAYKPLALSEFVTHVRHVQSLGNVWIDSVINIGAYWLAQRLFTELCPTISGNRTTWRWSLPKHFPPKQVLRVKISGGTLRQLDRVLTWHEQGYYELDLDAGELILLH